MSPGALCPDRQPWPLLVVGMLICSAVSGGAAVTGQLPRSDAARDPAWIARLPPLTLPLPRLSASAGASAPSARPAPAPVAPVSVSVSVAGADQGADQGAPPTVGAETMSRSTAATQEVIEDSTRVEIIARQAIGTPAEESAARAPSQPSVPAPTPSVVARPEAVSTGQPPAAAGAAPVAPGQPELPAAAPTPGYRWQVQLLAGRSLDRVRDDWRLFVERHRSRLEGLTLAISQSHFGDARDDFYRLRVLDWTDKATADRWCARLRATGGQCFVTRVTAPPG